jgi:histidyl-tRNA synthetase
MILEHEIPKGTRLYFGKSATLKREIESSAAAILESNDFKEIVSPLLSYHQHHELDESDLIRFTDEENRTVTLRADPTMDVVRLITKRVDKSDAPKRWFYIQPIFKYPSSEYHQVGAEFIGESDVGEAVRVSSLIFEQMKMMPLLQISNIEIPRAISKITGLDIEIFETMSIEKMLELDLPWLDKLARLHTVQDLKQDIGAPDAVEQELDKIRAIAKEIAYKEIVIAPLYYASMRYYNGIYFRFIKNNSALCVGGSYQVDGNDAMGFALYTDSIIEVKE